MKSAARSVRDDHQKTIVKLFDQLCGRHTRWQLWSDFIVMAAISISNTVDKKNYNQREESYKAIASKYSPAEIERFAEILSEVALGLDQNPAQDFLGELFMAMELSNEWKGQFFTPYSVCAAMAAITGGDIKERLAREHWISVNDPACGAGALLVAFANECRRPGNDVNYQTSVLFVAQDIDMIAGCMCYIQLSLLGCPGYVVIDDTIVKPSTSYDKRGLIPRDGGNVWYTPMYYRDVWHYRRLWTQMDMCFGSIPDAVTSPEAKPEPPAELPAEAPVPPTHNADKFGQLTLF